MDKLFFADKNLLYITNIDNYPYLDYIREQFAKYFKKSHFFNYSERMHNNGVLDTERHIAKLIKEHNIDIVMPFFFPTNFELSLQYFRSLQKTVKIIFWFFDDDTYFDVINKYYGQVADVVLTTDYYPSLGYRKYGIPSIYVPPIHNTKDFHPVETKKDIDVCFLGNCTKSDRMEYLEFLTNNGIKLETFGHGSKNGFIPDDKISQVYSRSKIALTFNKVEQPNWVTADDPMLNRVRQNKGHFSQISLTGSFCLAEYAPTIDVIAEIGKEIAVFYTKKDLLIQVNYYLSNTSERETIAANAYKKAIQSFDGNIAIPKLINELSALFCNYPQYAAQRNEIIYTNHSFNIKAVNGLTFTICSMLSKGNIIPAVELFVRALKHGFSAFVCGFSAGIVRVAHLYLSKLLKE